MPLTPESLCDISVRTPQYLQLQPGGRLSSHPVHHRPPQPLGTVGGVAGRSRADEVQQVLRGESKINKIRGKPEWRETSRWRTQQRAKDWCHSLWRNAGWAGRCPDRAPAGSSRAWSCCDSGSPASACRSDSRSRLWQGKRFHGGEENMKDLKAQYQFSVYGWRVKTVWFFSGKKTINRLIYPGLELYFVNSAATERWFRYCVSHGWLLWHTTIQRSNNVIFLNKYFKIYLF